MFKFFQDFKDFAVKGNMIDIAIGVIIGTAFNKVVDVLVKEILLPPLSMLTDGINYANKRIVLREAITVDGELEREAVAIGYGKFIEVSIDFVVIAITVFIVIRFMNSLKDKAEDVKDPSVKTPKDIELLNRVTDLLEEQNKLLREEDKL